VCWPRGTGREAGKRKPEGPHPLFKCTNNDMPEGGEPTGDLEPERNPQDPDAGKALKGKPVVTKQKEEKNESIDSR